MMFDDELAIGIANSEGLLLYGKRSHQIYDVVGFGISVFIVCVMLTYFNKIKEMNCSSF